VPICPILDRGRIDFGTAKDGKKVRNIVANPMISLAFDTYGETWAHNHGVVVRGEARMLDSGERFRQIRALLYQKFSQYEASAPLEEGDSVIIEVTPQQVFSWGFVL
jgi:coenzyme F420-0:L-glutamate ligase / coenzyme F420-1:gamma-L-glutamate ligase